MLRALSTALTRITSVALLKVTKAIGAWCAFLKASDHLFLLLIIPMTDFDPNFRALCAELARAAQWGALATPPPEPPTDDELNALWNCCGDHDEDGDHYGNIFKFARAAIKRWGAK